MQREVLEFKDEVAVLEWLKEHRLVGAKARLAGVYTALDCHGLGWEKLPNGKIAVRSIPPPEERPKDQEEDGLPHHTWRHVSP